MKIIDGLEVSEPKVMRSAAGFYIGRSCTSEYDFQEPYDRLTGYFDTREDAEKVLPQVIAYSDMEDMK